jgi:hypothetical protein
MVLLVAFPESFSWCTFGRVCLMEDYAVCYRIPISLYAASNSSVK